MRICQSLPHLIQTIAELEQRGIGFRLLTECIDTMTPAAVLLAGGRL